MLAKTASEVFGMRGRFCDTFADMHAVGLPFLVPRRIGVCLIVSRLPHCHACHHQQINHCRGSASRRFGVTIPFWHVTHRNEICCNGDKSFLSVLLAIGKTLPKCRSSKSQC